MRGTAAGLATPYPLATLLPPVLQEDPIAVQLTAALDDVLAPVIATLDCLHAYVDPDLAPRDFLEWLAGWVGAVLDERWPQARQRITVARAVELYRLRGTVAGLRAHVEVATGGVVEVVDSGGVSWSQSPSEEPDGPEETELLVRVRPPAGAGTDAAAVHAIVAAVKPAHIPHRVENLEAPSAAADDSRRGSPTAAS